MSRRQAATSNSDSGQQPPPFLSKTYDLVSDPASNSIVSWGPDGTSFIVWKQDDFSRNLLPQYFKHNNFSSFVRQLNTYGFRKVDADKWEFSQEQFVQGRRDLLSSIHRRRPAASGANANAAQQTAIEVGQFGGLVDEVEGLKRDKNVLMVELVRLRQQQQLSDREIQILQTRLDAQEQRQRQMMAFLSKALQHPNMLQQLVGARQNVQRIAGADGTNGRKKLKRRAVRQDESSVDSGGHDNNQLVQYQATPLGNDYLSGLMSLDGLGDMADSGDSGASPNNLMEVGSALNSMSLAHQNQNGGSTWPSSVTIREHEQMPTSMPPIPSSVPRVSSTPLSSGGGPADSAPKSAAAAAMPPQPLTAAGLPSMAEIPQELPPMSSGPPSLSSGFPPMTTGRMDSIPGMPGLPPMSCGDAAALFGSSNGGLPPVSAPLAATSNPLGGEGVGAGLDGLPGGLGDMGAALDGAEGMAGLQGGAMSPGGIGSAELGTGTYNADDFNFDLLNSAATGGEGALDLPTEDTLSNSDAALWQEFMTSPSEAGS